MREGTRRRAGTLLSSAALAFACRSEIDDAPVLRDSVTSRALLDHSELGSGSFASSACYPCAERSCAGEDEACRFDPGCTVYRDCLLSCPGRGETLDPGCVEDCNVADNSTSERLSTELRECLTSVDCATCLGDGGVAKSAPLDTRPECSPEDPNPNECKDCGWARCCDYRLACEETEQCWPFQECLVECDGPLAECVPRCEQDLPEGKRPFLQMLECHGQLCTAQCNGPAPCIECIGRECNTLALACIADAECWTMMECMAVSCGGATDYARCEEECAAATTLDGAASYREWTDCWLGRCSVECSQ